jgi:hypothetical protein
MLFYELYCIASPEKLVFFGDLNGDTAAGIRISFEECDSKTNTSCLTKGKKKEFFTKADYFIVTI